jgi:hypothetical protein
MFCVSERHKRMAPKGEDTEKKDEEEWPLKDVIFVEDVKTVPVGRVLKVDGDYAAVRFPTSKEGKDSNKEASTTGTAEDANVLLAECRLMRTDDLQVRKTCCENSEINKTYINSIFIAGHKIWCNIKITRLFPKNSKKNQHS